MFDQNKEKKQIEGEDFYLTPEGYKCFTEKHHLKRGYCCKSGCRHCPYGFDKNTGHTSCAFKKKLKKVVHFENKFVYLIEFQTVKYNEQPCTKLQNNFK